MRFQRGPRCAGYGLDERQVLAHALRDRFELDPRAGDVAEEVLGRPAHPLAPQLAQQRARFAAREPRVAELAAQVCAQLRLERPRAEVRRDVEARVDVAEVVGRARLDLQRVGEQLDVPRAHRLDVVRRVELELVLQLRRVAAYDEQEQRGAVGSERLGTREVEPPRQPHGIVGEVLQQHRPAFGDGAVAEPALLDLQLGARVREVLGVARLVEKRRPVVRAAHRLDDEHHLPRHLDRRAERARRLVRPLLDVEVDVLLLVDLHAEVLQRRIERGEHPLRGERGVPLRRAHDARDVPALGLVEADADALAEEAVDRVLVQRLGRGDERTALLGELVELVLEAVVELTVRRDAEVAHRGVRLEMAGEQDRIHVLVRQLVADPLEALALRAVVVVRDRGAQHAERDLVAVDGCRQRRLGLRRLLVLLARQRAEVALAREAPELARAEAAVDRLLQPLRLLEGRHVLVLAVDRLEVEVGLQARVVLVVLLVEVGDETVDALAVCVGGHRRRIWLDAGDPHPYRAAHAAARHHARGRGRPERSRRRVRRARLRPAHDRRRDDQRARRSRGRARLRGRARAHGRRGLGLAAHRGGRGERALARARRADGAAGARTASRRPARTRDVAGDLPLRARRAARAQRVRHAAGVKRWVVAAAAALACAGAALGSDASKPRSTIPPDIHLIKHVIVIMQENRSFDSYFGTYPGADGIPKDVCLPDPVRGGCVRPYHDTNDRARGGPHGQLQAVRDVDGGRMDGFVAEAEAGKALGCKDANDPACTIPGAGTDVMGWHDQREIPNYWAYARNFVLQDHMFEPNASWSLPAHLFMVSEWSARCTIPGDPKSCVNALQAPGSPPDFKGNKTKSIPDYAWTDLTYLLHEHHVSWRYYVMKGTEPDCEDDAALTCGPVKQGPKTPGIWNPLPYFDTVKDDGQLADVTSLDEFYKAARAGTLPSVAWITPAQKVSEHPPGLVSAGQSYVTSLVNAVMKGPDWSSTAIFLAWDDWGGFYDHVVPPKVDENGYGLRVPGLLISPYAKRGYIDHQTLSFDAYVKFIEDDFLGGQRLDPRTDGRPDPRPDVRENEPILGDLLREFDFAQPPRPPLVLNTDPVWR